MGSMLTYCAFKNQDSWGVTPCRLINSCRRVERSQCVHLWGPLVQESTAGLSFETSVSVYRMTVSTIPEQHRCKKLSYFAFCMLWNQSPFYICMPYRLVQYIHSEWKEHYELLIGERGDTSHGLFSIQCQCLPRQDMVNQNTNKEYWTLD
jgi:hypothetical protein